MKKGRPGSVVHVLADPALSGHLRDVLRETTGSLGVRSTVTERWPAARSMESVWLDGQLIRVKVSAGRVKAEYEDVALAARRTGQSLRDLSFRAEARWRAEHDVKGGSDGHGSGFQLVPVERRQTAVDRRRSAVEMAKNSSEDDDPLGDDPA